jgi:hypothetical protein
VLLPSSRDHHPCRVNLAALGLDLARNSRE